MTHDVMYIIQSLKPDDLQLGKILADNLKAANDLLLKSEDIFFFHKLDTKEEIFNLLDKIAEESEERHPIIHFQMHGDKMCIGTTRYHQSNNEADLITWEELASHLRPINIKTQNNLFITVASCIGAAFIQTIHLNLPAPVACYIGSFFKIPFGNIIASYDEFYNAYLRDGNLDNAKQIINAESKKWFEENKKDLLKFGKMSENDIDNFRYDFITSEGLFRFITNNIIKDEEKTYEKKKAEIDKTFPGCTEDEKKVLFKEERKIAVMGNIEKMQMHFSWLIPFLKTKKLSTRF